MIKFLLVLPLTLFACAPLNIMQHRKPPTAAYALDFIAFGAGAVVGMDGQWSHPVEKNQMILGYSFAALFWLPYWIVN